MCALQLYLAPASTLLELSKVGRSALKHIWFSCDSGNKPSPLRVQEQKLKRLYLWIVSARWNRRPTILLLDVSATTIYSHHRPFQFSFQFTSQTPTNFSHVHRHNVTTPLFLWVSKSDELPHETTIQWSINFPKGVTRCIEIYVYTGLWEIILFQALYPSNYLPEKTKKNWNKCFYSLLTLLVPDSRNTATCIRILAMDLKCACTFANPFIVLKMVVPKIGIKLLS